MLKIAGDFKGEFNRSSTAFKHRNPASDIFGFNRAFYKLAEKSTSTAGQKSDIITAIKGVKLTDSIPNVAKAFREIFSTWGIDFYAPEAVCILRKAGITPSLASWYIVPAYIRDDSKEYGTMRSLLVRGGYTKSEADATVRERQGWKAPEPGAFSKALTNFRTYD